MDLTNIMELWDRFEKSSVSEMEFDYQDIHFSLKKPTAQVEYSSVATPGVVVAPVIESAEAVNPSESEFKEIKTPLVGTFYCAASPDSEPFVKVGQKISKGDVIGIVEAMKLMNEVTATEDGVVQEILVKNGMLVEYNQTLILVK